MGFVRILVIVQPPHWSIYPLVDHTLVVDHTLEPSVDDRGTWRHRSEWSRREFRGRPLTVLDDRLPEIVWQESEGGNQTSNRKGIGTTKTYCSSIRFISGDIDSNSFVLRLARSGLSSKRISSSS